MSATTSLFVDHAPVIFRPYQRSMMASWRAAVDRGVRRGLIVAATGTGKTTTFGGILGETLESDPQSSAIVLAHRKELLEQAADRIRQMHPHLPVGIEGGDYRCAGFTRVAVASVQTLGLPGSTRLDWMKPSLVVCDEAHHSAADTFQSVFRRFGCYGDGALLLGVTATPHRLDNLALVGDRERAIFEEIVFRYDIVDAINDGFLVDLKGYRAAADMDLSKVKTVGGDYVQNQLERAVNVHPVNELAFKSWSEVAADRQTMVFCSGVGHAQAVAELFRDQGIKAEAVYGDMPMRERSAIIERFRSGQTQVLTNMDLLTEGFDAQHVGAIVLLRPTQSWTLYVQMVGRGLRTLPGVIDGIGEPADRRAAIAGSAKPNCIVIDIVANTDSHSLTAKPGGRTKPSLQELVGLPPAMELDGRTVVEALREFRELPEVVQSAFFARETSFSGLSAVLTQVEMLSELKVPEELQDAGCQLYWLKVGESAYSIDCGKSDEGIQRRAHLACDLLGAWTLTLQSRDRGTLLRDEAVHLAGAEPFLEAETLIRQRFAGVHRTANRFAEWRTAPPSPKQIAMLQRFGVEESILEMLDRGKASAMIGLFKERAMAQGGMK